MKVLILGKPNEAHSKLTDFLDNRGNRILKATTIQRAMGLLKLHRIRIILCFDTINTTDRNTLHCFLRKSPPSNHIYFVLMGIGEDYTNLEQGIDAYLPDPLDFDMLEALLHEGTRVATLRPHKPPVLVKNSSDQLPLLPETSERHSPENGRIKTVQGNNPLEQDITEYDILFARTAIDINLLTRKELAHAFTYQKQQGMLGRNLFICEAFSALGILPAEKLDRLRKVTKQRLDKKFGFVALKRKMITLTQLKRALKAQEEEFKTTQTYRLTGDILAAHGAITTAQRDRLRHEMRGITTAGTRDASAAGKPNGKKGSQSINHQPVFQIIISTDRLEARLKIENKSAGFVSVEQIFKRADDIGIRYGMISQDSLADFLKIEQDRSDPFTIARGQRPVPGCDAAIRYHFDNDYLTAGKTNQDGSINYQERGQVPKVKTGDLLAEKKALQTGKPGLDVFGHPIDVADAKDIDLNCGPGTLLAEDGMKLYASVDGRPELAASGKISVFDELIIDKDVDFSTGNINFDGRVRIKGAVKNGFAVTCGSLIVQEVVHGKISAVGDVTVQFGIIDADIQAEGSITSRFITDSNIKAFGDVVVEKDVVNSKIRSSGKFTAGNGKIISSFISAKMGVTAKQIGTDISPACRIQVGIDENARKKIQRYDAILEEKKRMLASVQKQYEKRDEPFPLQQEMVKEETSQLLNQIKVLIQSIEDLSSEKKAIRTWSDCKKGNSVVEVYRQIFQGSKILGIHSATRLLETMTNVCIREMKNPDSSRWSMVVEAVG